MYRLCWNKVHSVTESWKFKRFCGEAWIWLKFIIVWNFVGLKLQSIFSRESENSYPGNGKNNSSLKRKFTYMGMRGVHNTFILYNNYNKAVLNEISSCTLRLHTVLHWMIPINTERHTEYIVDRRTAILCGKAIAGACFSIPVHQSSAVGHKHLD